MFLLMTPSDCTISGTLWIFWADPTGKAWVSALLLEELHAQFETDSRDVKRLRSFAYDFR